MRVLVIGGTRFVGRHLAEAAAARGHQVTLFHRGRTGNDVLPEAAHVLGDRDQDLDLDRLADGSWDATIDACAYVPRQVGQLADALAGRGGQLALISSVSVYAEPIPFAGTEDAPLEALADPSTEVVDGTTYGGLKVLCEQVAVERFGPTTLLLRPTYVVGPHDYTRRFGYWVERIAAGGAVLAPGPRDRGIQLIDGRDLATWTISLLERGVAGAFHAVDPEPGFTFEQLLTAVVDAIGPPGTALTWVDSSFLREQGVDGSDLPLWDADDPGFGCSPARALGSGLAPRDLSVTVADTLADLRSGHWPAPAPGLSRGREAELLAAWARR